MKEPNQFKRILELGFDRQVPIIPPDVPISPKSSLYRALSKGADKDPRGKAVGIKGSNGEWYGFDWVNYTSTLQDCVTWHDMGAGVGIKTGLQSDGTWLLAIDVDTLNEKLAKLILEVLRRHFGPLSVRIGRSPKAAYLIRTAVEFRYTRIEFDGGQPKDERLEILSDGRQIVVHGIHPYTKEPYRWPDDMPALRDIPITTPEKLHAFLAELGRELPAAKPIVTEGATAIVDQATLKGNLDVVRKAMGFIRNTTANFPTREAYRDLGYALKAALPDRPEEALELFQDWAASWEDPPGGEGNDPDVVASDWRRMKPPFRRGAAYIYALAQRLSGGAFNAAAELWFDEGAAAAAAEAAPNEAATGPGVGHNSNSFMLPIEDDAAIRFAEQYGERLRYCCGQKRWLEFRDGIWRADTTKRAFHWARLLVREMAREHDIKVKTSLGKAAFAGAVERYAQSDPVFAVSAEIWDQNTFLLGTPGGTVDLKTGRLRPADPRDSITKTTAVQPAEQATCPLWLRFLSESTGDDAGLMRFLQQWCGYCLTGDTREHALVFMFGDGGNGKSVFIRVITGILSSYAATATMDVFIASRGEKHSTEVAMLHGARLVTASETEEGRDFAEAKIKQLTGGDPITARFMRQDNFTFIPQFKLTIVGNHKPGLRNIDAAARRRFNMVPFTRTPKTPDPLLEERLRAEWPGILRWAIDGCLDWQRNGLLRPTAVTDATKRYFDEQDLLGQWVDEHCSTGNAMVRTPSKELFASWESFAKAANESVGTATSFSHRLQRLGFESVEKAPTVTGGRARGFAGIALRHSDTVPN